jgi:dihydrofolate synthase/folylpolyglutamate synthase
MTSLYLDSLHYLFSRLNYERAGMPRTIGELRLSRMRRLLRLLDDPQRALAIVHVAGTKGKGSTSAMISSALTASGARTGLYCSPHLHRLEERYQIDGAVISEGELVALVDAVRPAVEAVDSFHFDTAVRPLTFFEITTAMGLLHFARRGCRCVVLEVGLGGRLDSTNVVRPAVAVITSISFDHMKLLGSTLGAIATEKAGILKRRCTAVIGVRGTEPRAAIERVALQRRATLRSIGDDFTMAYSPPVPPLAVPTPGRVRVRTWRRSWEPKTLPLLGSHQAENATTALAALDALAERDPSIEVNDAHVDTAWSSLQFPARIEVIKSRPCTVVDSAHNVASARALADTLVTHFPSTPRTLVFGTTRDKDLPGQLEVLLPHFDRVVATRYLENPRAVSPVEIEVAIGSLRPIPVTLAESPADALDAARRITPRDDLICVSGSLFLAAEARAVLLGLTPPPNLTPAPASATTPALRAAAPADDR